MGFLDKLFAKKICDICGGEIGLLGNKSLKTATAAKTAQKSSHLGLMKDVIQL